MNDNKQPEWSDCHQPHLPAPPMPDPIARAEQGTSGDLFGHLGLKRRRDAIQTSEKCLLRIVVFPQMVGGCLELNPNTSPLGDVWHVKSLNQFVQSLLSQIAKSRVHFQNTKVSNEPWERWSISLPQRVLIVDLCFHRRSVGHILGVFLDAVDWMFLGYQWRKPINQPRVLTLLCSHWQHSHTKACISTEETTARPRSSRATSNSTTWPWPTWIATVHPSKVIRSTYIPPCKIC